MADRRQHREQPAVTTDETALIAALKQREPQALAQAFELYAAVIYRLALSILHDEQQADGVVQDTFLKLIEHIDGFEGRARLSTWLYRVAYHECTGRIRRAKPLLNLDDFPEDETVLPAHFVDWQTLPEQALSSRETADQIQQAIDGLPPTLRLVFILRDVEECSTRQTADILGLTEAAVKVRLHRARLALREALAAYFEEYLHR
jgi:RNA polymerase sigma-70 factor (ECF subfamily)